MDFLLYFLYLKFFLIFLFLNYFLYARSCPPCFLFDFSLLLVITFLNPFVPDGLLEFELSFLFWFFSRFTSAFNFWFSFSSFSIFVSLSFNLSFRFLISLFWLYTSFVSLSTCANNSSICLNISFIWPLLNFFTTFFDNDIISKKAKYCTLQVCFKNITLWESI